MTVHGNRQPLKPLFEDSCRPGWSRNCAEHPRVISNPLALVNAPTSPFGAGWSLAGLRQLHDPSCLGPGGPGHVAQYMRKYVDPCFLGTAPRP